MKVLRTSVTVTEVKTKNAYVVSLVKKLREAKTAAEIRLASASTVEDKVYYQKLIADLAQDIQSAIDCYITVY